jgi:hypothetical protein
VRSNLCLFPPSPHLFPSPLLDTTFARALSWSRFAALLSLTCSPITPPLPPASPPSQQSRTGTKDLQHVDLKLRVLFRPIESQLPHIHATYGSNPFFFLKRIQLPLVSCHDPSCSQAPALSKASFHLLCKRLSSLLWPDTMRSSCSQ